MIDRDRDFNWPVRASASSAVAVQESDEVLLRPLGREEVVIDRSSAPAACGVSELQLRLAESAGHTQESDGHVILLVIGHVHVDALVEVFLCDEREVVRLLVREVRPQLVRPLLNKAGG